MKTSQPKVSILSSSYNHIHFIEDFIKSVYAQDYSNFELLMLDDGSKDGSDKKLLELSKTYGFSAFSRKNQGFPNALNTLRKQATGDYILIIASDDMMPPDRLTKQVEYLEQNKDCAIVCGNMQEINEHGVKGKHIEYPFSKDNMFEPLLLGHMYILAPTVMIRTSALNQIGAYDEDLMVEDFDMWLRLAQEFPFGHINHTSAFYRKHDGNEHGNYERSYQQKELVFNKYKHHPLYKQAMTTHYRNAFSFLSGLKDFRDLAKTYKSKAKSYGALNRQYIKACVKYYFLAK